MSCPMHRRTRTRAAGRTVRHCDPVKELLAYGRIADDEKGRLQTEAGHGQHLALIDLGHHHHAVLSDQRLDRARDLFERLVGCDCHAVAVERSIRAGEAEAYACDADDGGENDLAKRNCGVHLFISFFCEVWKACLPFNRECE